MVMQWDLLLAAHAGSTLFMTGVIWFVQVVHYPLFARIQDKEYFAAHQRLTTYVVLPPMFCELGCALWIWWQRMSLVNTAAAVFLVAIWLSTALIQVPLHRKLEAGADPSAIRKLVQTNWIRTLLWSARALIVLGA